ncbi:hypothetical protein SAMN04488095_3828 [Jannaschia pohangensis]|uniref:Methanogenic corrinoid protein MtbC1 n=2 Tax=Jannaschia pohangensis TaxID=390807 RepID=A0A1I3UTE9_9RHOB|nr:hypothetical protein SAMN04488095_3828 [Jannaschia pohangensis]
MERGNSLTPSREDSQLQPLHHQTELMPLDELARVAKDALSQVAEESRRMVRKPLLQRFVTSTCDADPTAFRAVVDQMRSALVRDEDIIDLYIPAAARVLGDAWLEDRLNWATVSIASSRLAGIVRWLEDCTPIPPRCGALARLRILIRVPEGAQHTLGMFVLASQLRRRGLCVRALLDPAEMPDTRDFDVVLISATGRESLAKLQACVIKSRTFGRAPLVALGGGIIGTAHGLLGRTGADLVTNDIEEVLQSCRAATMPNGPPTLRSVT